MGYFVVRPSLVVGGRSLQGLGSRVGVFRLDPPERYRRVGEVLSVPVLVFY